MVSRRVNKTKDSAPRRPPATTPDQRENELISLATDVAERQMRDGSASAQVISYYLKLGSSREKLEQERIANENRLMDQKIEALKSQQRVEELYANALSAMQSYQGYHPAEEDGREG